MEKCPSCQNGNLLIFFEIEKFPIHTTLNMRTKEMALSYPKGVISLGVCESCGFISNTRFDESLLDYSPEFEETQGFSPYFNRFAKSIAEKLIKKYNIIDKSIIEIGCGKGEFLILLCELGNNTGTGFDPAYAEGRLSSPALNKIKIIKDYYSDKYSDYKADIIVCRMTLEHIHKTYDFMRAIRKSIGEQPDTIIFFQVPNAVRILKSCAFEDIYYEHCSYFTPGSLIELFEAANFEVLNLDLEFENQYITIEAKPVNYTSKTDSYKREPIEKIITLANNFTNQYNNKIELWNKRLSNYGQNKEKIVLWGSGSKGVAFLNSVSEASFIDYVVDINPNRQGTYMAGTGQKIIAPDDLISYAPDRIIIMNEVYFEEIQKKCKELNLETELTTT